MVNMEDTKLIQKLKEFKNISPSKECVFLTKNQILDEGALSNIAKQSPVAALPGWVGGLFQQKFAYAFLALAVVTIGAVGVMQFGGLGSDLANKNAAALVEVKNNVEMLKVKSKELASLSKEDKESFSAAASGVREVAKQITQKIQQDPALAKEVALEINNNKTYLDIPATAETETTELKATSDELYKEIDIQMIADLEKASLTESQKDALKIAKDLFEEARYADALESILLLSMAIQSN